MFDRIRFKSDAKNEIKFVIVIFIIFMALSAIILVAGGGAKTISVIRDSAASGQKLSNEELQTISEEIKVSPVTNILSSILLIVSGFCYAKACLIAAIEKRKVEITEFFRGEAWKELGSWFLKTFVAGLIIMAIGFGVFLIFLVLAMVLTSSAKDDWVIGMPILMLVICVLTEIIVGIIVGINYRFVGYYAIEEPELSVGETLKKSRAAVSGNRWNMFVMDPLSFILWDILTSITCGLASIYVLPYRKLAEANAYLALKK